MREDVSKLIQLQKVQSEISRVEAEVAELPRHLATIEAKLAGAKQDVAAAEAKIKKGEHDRRERESEIKDWNAKIIKLREQSSSVKTNEQYRALLDEIAYAEKEISKCEEKIIISMEEADGLKKELAAAQAELKADAIEVEKEKEHARAVTAKDEAELAKLREERDGFRAGLDENKVITFDRIVAKRGTAMAEVIEGNCSACHVSIRPQRLNDLLNDAEFITCDSCGRILYVDPSHQVALAEKKAAGPERAWYYLPGEGNGAFAFVSNSKTGTVLRTYDTQTGDPISHESRKKTTYQEAFGAMLAGAQPLHFPHSVAEGESIPGEALEELQLQANLPVTG
jgi:predicted  nucleic acid-binding Zn-ribbon protein